MAAGITINGSGIGGAFVGSSEVDKIYLGSVEVYSKPSADLFSIDITFGVNMDGVGWLTGVYGTDTIFDHQDIAGDTPPASYQVPIVSGQQMTIRYYVDYGYCNVTINGTQVHSGGQSGTYTWTPQVGDVVTIDYYFED